MTKYIPNLKAIIPFGILCVLAGIFSFSAKADSTITIPIPKDYPDRKVTLSLRIPAQTEPLSRKEQAKPVITSNRIVVWDSDPTPKIANDDELLVIFNNMLKKGWIRDGWAKTCIRTKPMEKCFAIHILKHIYDNILELGRYNNFSKVSKKVKLTASDIEDIRRMLKRFERDIILIGDNYTKIDKDLLVLQERFKKDTQGILKVIRVEGTEDGATVIHMTVD